MKVQVRIMQARFQPALLILFRNHCCYAATSARSKLHSYCSHCKRAGSGEGKLTYSKDTWVFKLLQEKIILPSYVSWHCHSVVASIKKPTHVFTDSELIFHTVFLQKRRMKSYVIIITWYIM